MLDYHPVEQTNEDCSTGFIYTEKVSGARSNYDNSLF